MRRKILPIEKIAKIRTKDLPIEHRKGEPKEHYVYVREYDCSRQVYKVNICTHLEVKNKRTGAYENDKNHLRQVKYGNTYPVPIYSANFPVWTGIKREVYEVPKGKMRDWNCVQFKGKHKREKNDGFYSSTVPKGKK